MFLFAIALLTQASADPVRDTPLTTWPDSMNPRQITPTELPQKLAPLEIYHISANYPKAITKHTSQGRILVLVESDLYPDISTSLDTYVDDLTLEGYEVLLEESSYGDADELKTYLKTLYNESSSLTGAVLIGDLPIAWYEIANDYPGYGGYGYALFPSDLYLADMNGMWYDIDSNNIPDKHSGNQNPEIWIGRMIVTPTMGDEAKILNSYFERNHAFRRGEILTNGTSLVYIDDDWSYYATSYNAEIKYGFDTELYSEQNETKKSDYLSHLTGEFDNIAVFVHSSPEAHYFVYNSNYDTMYYPEVPENASALFYDLFACSNANFSEYIYMAGVYAFNTDKGLLSLGSTKTGSMLMRTTYYDHLGNFYSFGESLKQWWIAVNPYNDPDSVSWFYGLTHTGDPTLRVGYPTVETNIEEIYESSQVTVEIELDLLNTGLDYYNYSAETDAPWIKISPSSGTVKSSNNITVTLDPSQMAKPQGEKAEITIHAPGATNNPFILPVTFGDWGDLEFCIDDLSIDLSPNESKSVSLDVNACDGGIFEWQVSTDSSWIGFDKNSGLIGDKLALTIEGLDQGVYNTELTFVSDYALNSPLTVNVDVYVGEPITPGCSCNQPGMQLNWGLLGIIGLLGVAKRRLSY